MMPPVLQVIISLIRDTKLGQGRSGLGLQLGLKSKRRGEAELVHVPCTDNEVKEALDWDLRGKLATNCIKYFELHYASHAATIAVLATYGPSEPRIESLPIQTKNANAC